jgi:hypothetical protein
MDDRERMRRPLPNRSEPNRNFGNAFRYDSWAARDPLWNERFSRNAPESSSMPNGTAAPEWNSRSDRGDEVGRDRNGYPGRDNVGHAINAAYNLSDQHIHDGRREAENQYSRRYDSRSGARPSSPYRRQFDHRFGSMAMDPTAQMSRMIAELMPLATGVLSSLSAAACASLFPYRAAYRMFPPMMNQGHYCERCGYDECRCRSYCQRCGYYECRCRRDWDSYGSAGTDSRVSVQITSPTRSAQAELDLREYCATMVVSELKSDDGKTLGTPLVITANGLSVVTVKIDNDTTKVPAGWYHGFIVERDTSTPLGKLRVYVSNPPGPSTSAGAPEKASKA